MGRMRTFALAASFALASSACVEPPDLALPTVEEVEARYDYPGGLEASMSGNVAEVTVSQPSSQIRRGGTLWAKVGPYIILFNEETRTLFEDYPGLAGVRAVTRIRGGPEIARALLTRSELTDVLWRRSMNIAGRARTQGTERPALLQDLVRWGEDHTEFEYNPRYVKR